MKHIRAYIELLKPRILTMQFISVSLGYLMAGGQTFPGFPTWGIAIIGTALVSGGAAAWNHAIEWRQDALMERTHNRPIPSGLISPLAGVIYGTTLCASGIAILALFVNPLCSFLAMLTALLYVVVYTPLKKLTWLNTFVGAIPGAIPPLGGWAAATGNLSIGAWSLFLILFIWQLPHFFAIAWMYKDDYAKAGFKMLSVEDPTGRRTVFQILVFTVILIIVSLWPVSLGLLHRVYALGALIGGLLFLKTGVTFAKTRSRQEARQVLKGSVYYLPALFLLMAIDAFLFIH